MAHRRPQWYSGSPDGARRPKWSPGGPMGDLAVENGVQEALVEPWGHR